LTSDRSIKALRVRADGSLQRVDLEAGAEGDHLQSMYREIGCNLVDCVGLRADLDLWLDDEGKLKDNWEVNLAASALLQRHGIPDLVAGTALLTGGADEEGYTLGISDETASDVERLLGKGGGG
jgi:hypothetical protein